MYSRETDMQYVCDFLYIKFAILGQDTQPDNYIVSFKACGPRLIVEFHVKTWEDMVRF